MTVYPKFTLKIGYTQDSTFPNGPNKYDTFKTGLTTVYGPATFTARGVDGGVDSVGRWVRIPLSTPFNYTPEQKRFVVEISRGEIPGGGGVGFNIMFTNTGTVPHFRSLGGLQDSTRALNKASTKYMDLGIDFGTTSIVKAGNITELRISPNPSNGQFMIGFSAHKAISSVGISLINTIGQVVMQKLYTAGGNKWSETVYCGSLAKGTYYLKLDADGEIASRKLIIN